LQKSGDFFEIIVPFSADTDIFNMYQLKATRRISMMYIEEEETNKRFNCSNVKKNVF